MSRSPRRRLLSAFVLPVLFAACVQAPPPPLAAMPLPARAVPSVRPAPVPLPVAMPLPAPPPKQPGPFLAGTSVEGRPLEVHVRGTGPDVVLVMATIHGSEPAGTPLAHALLAFLDANPRLLHGRQVLVMPDVNPDGHAAGTRRNAHGVDLNRNFEAPGRRDGGRFGEGALSEPEAVAVERLVDHYRPARILSIHQPLSCVDWDGPAEALARRVAAACDLPIRKLGTRPGSFGAWAEAHGVALVTLELPRGVEGESAAALWKRYGEALRVFVSG